MGATRLMQLIQVRNSKRIIVLFTLGVLTLQGCRDFRKEAINECRVTFLNSISQQQACIHGAALAEIQWNLKGTLGEVLSQCEQEYDFSNWVEKGAPYDSARKSCICGEVRNLSGSEATQSDLQISKLNHQRSRECLISKSDLTSTKKLIENSISLSEDLPQEIESKEKVRSWLAFDENELTGCLSACLESSRTAWSRATAGE